MKRRSSIVGVCAVLLCLGAHGAALAQSVAASPRLIVMPPERRAWLAPGRAEIPVTMYNVNSRETRTFLLTADGRLVDGKTADVVTDLDRFFRCKRSGRSHKMAPQVIAVLADVARHHPGHVIEVISGFRRRGAGAPHSKHFTGHAIDFRVRGVSTAEVRDMVWATHASIGLGHYSVGDFLHVDHRPAEPKIAWTQRREGGHYHYHPAWAGGPPPKHQRAALAAAPVRERAGRELPAARVTKTKKRVASR